MSRENLLWFIAIIRTVQGATFCCRKCFSSSYAEEVRDIFNFDFYTTQSCTHKTDQNEKSNKVCKTASLNFFLFQIHWLSPGATFYAIAAPLAIYTKTRDVTEETKFVILYPKIDLFCRKMISNSIEWSIFWYCRVCNLHGYGS